MYGSYKHYPSVIATVAASVFHNAAALDRINTVHGKQINNNYTIILH